MIRATITDRQALDTLNYERVLDHLAACGFERHRTKRDGVDQWKAPREVTVRGIPKRWITMPAREAAGQFSDQTDAVASAVEIIAALQDRSQLDVFVDLGGDLGQ